MNPRAGAIMTVVTRLLSSRICIWLSSTSSVLLFPMATFCWSLLFTIQFWSAQFSRSVMSKSLWPHVLQHARPPCPSSTPGVHLNSLPSSQWCHPVISSSVVPFLLLPSIFPSIRVLSSESALLSRWPNCWSYSFNISPSNEHPVLISFRMDWLDFLAVQETLNSLQHHSSKAAILWHSFLHSPTLTSIHGHWKNHSLD